MSKWPEHKNPRPERAAKAPYNFVPLPDKVVTVEATDLPDQDRYEPQRHTGWIECTLTTSSPLYVRAALETDEFKRAQEEGEEKRPWREQVRNKPDFFYTSSDRRPVIPGSSVRGMLRTLVEIAGYGKVQWVTDQQRYFFRAVAAPRSDPLQEPYRNIIGAFARNVQAGYLVKKGDTWYVLPAIEPESKGWPERGSYLKVKERSVGGNVPNYVALDSPKYRPQIHDVTFDVDVRNGKRGRYVAISRMGPVDAGYSEKGVLVCSGNMLETASTGKPSRRTTHALILMPNNRAKPLKVRREAVEDYLAGLTPFQKDDLTAWGGTGNGCLAEGAPVFYVTEGNEIFAFGHCPNFRVPFLGPGARRASSPLDYVPEALRREEDIDLAEAIFGYTKSEGEGKKRSYAGRVFVTDGRLRDGQEAVWLCDGAGIIPRILGSPKPTTFQHYLAQTEPDVQSGLKHYGSETPQETVIRGHKLYWHKGEVTAGDIQEAKPDDSQDTQHTQIRPVRSGIVFDFRIHFENLSKSELGALLWVMQMAGNEDLRLNLGMGKPYGMGAVRIDSTLHETDRAERYKNLFDGTQWAVAAHRTDNLAREAIQEFEQLILRDRTLNPKGVASLEDLDRVRALLAMLSWPGPDPDATRYLLIEHPDFGNEYKDRPVLPAPVVAVPGEPVHTLRPAREEKQQKPQAEEQIEGEILIGTVKWFNDQKGYGFIAQSDGPDVFVHHSNIVSVGHKSLHEGQRVSYTVGQGKKGPEAQNVKPL